MTAEEILAFAKKFVDAIQAGDIATTRACYHPDAKLWHNTDGIEQTVDQNMKVLDWFIRTLPDGTKWAMDACVVIKIENGLITRLDEYLDSAQAGKLRAFGR